tara:strand:- start:8 stop:451 length:444 start_codon:yes stop_codon:yes gene_type:complete
MIFYSATARAFFDSDIHTAIPDDATEVTPARHAELIDAQASEAPVEIVPSETGTPIMSRSRTWSESEQRELLQRALQREQNRRIGQIADRQQQILDARLGGAEATARLAAIDDVVAQAASIATAIDAAPAGALTGFSVIEPTLWEAN